MNFDIDITIIVGFLIATLAVGVLRGGMYPTLENLH